MPEEPILTTKEWLQRIEGSLTRIEEKLDTKADRAEVLSVETRLRLLESLGSEQARSAESEVRQLAKDLTTLKVKVYSILGGIALVAAALEVLRQGGIAFH